MARKYVQVQFSALYANLHIVQFLIQMQWSVWEELHFTREMDSLIRQTGWSQLVWEEVKINKKKQFSSFVIVFPLVFILTKHCHLMEIIFVYLTQMIEILKCADFCFAILSFLVCSWKQNVMQITRLWKRGQGQAIPARLTCTPYNIFTDQNIVDLWLAVIEELTMMKMWHKSLNRENEVKIKWHLLDWHLHITMYL